MLSMINPDQISRFDQHSTKFSTIGGGNHHHHSSSLKKASDYQQYQQEAEDTMGNEMPKYSAGKTASNFYHSKQMSDV